MREAKRAIVGLLRLKANRIDRLAPCIALGFLLNFRSAPIRPVIIDILPRKLVIGKHG